MHNLAPFSHYSQITFTIFFQQICRRKKKVSSFLAYTHAYRKSETTFFDILSSTKSTSNTSLQQFGPVNCDHIKSSGTVNRGAVILIGTRMLNCKLSSWYLCNNRCHCSRHYYGHRYRSGHCHNPKYRFHPTQKSRR